MRAHPSAKKGSFKAEKNPSRKTSLQRQSLIIWVMLEPSSLTRMSGEFEEWSFPCIAMELDHQGCFRVLPSGEIFYEGGETKASYTGMSTASVSNVNYFSGSGGQDSITKAFFVD